MNKIFEVKFELFADLRDWNSTMKDIEEKVMNMEMADFTFDESQWIEVTDGEMVEIFAFFSRDTLHVNVNDIC